uniref:non-ribosomal peptide synthetase n=1 Tax=Pseudomonas cremoricolorata TaxID=157783 RepID=UPI00067EA7CE
GRLDHQVKVRGHRIELGEIETALAALPGVDHAIAVTTGSPLTLAAALVVPRLPENQAAWIAEVKLQLSARLPEYMVPSCLSLLSTLPLSGNGKVDRKQVLQSLQAQTTQVTVDHEPPQGERERRVAEVWQQILQRNDISRQQSFFALGGDSLLATQVISQLKRLGWGTAHGLRVLFAQPRLADFAAQLQPIQAGESVAPVLAEPAQRHAPFPLTEVQRAYWMGQSSGLPLNCGTRYLVELDGQDVDLSRIEQAWNRLLLQHDMLRAVIDEDGQQRILPHVPAASIELQQLGAADAGQLAAQVNQAWQQACCQAAPMHRLHAFLYGDRRCRLAIIFNYMTLDGFSIKRVLEQLARLYADPQATTEAPGLTFRDYVNQVRPSASAVKRAEEYWRARLDDLPCAAALPLACDPQSLSTVHFRRRQVVLPAADWQALCNRARQHDITPSVLLLTAYAQTLSRWSGGTSHTLNLTLFDRQEVHPDIHQVLGDFTSLAPVAFHPHKDAGLLAHARALQQGIVDALEHREVSSIWIQRERSRIGDRASAALPIVFTSTLGLGGGLFERPAPGFPEMVAAGMSETPQVWLDHQVYEYNGALVLTWDAVDALFPAGLLDDMFGAYQALLAQLQHATWEQPLNLALPQSQRQMRQRVNASEDPRRLRTLHADTFAQAMAHPQRPALIDEAGVMTFGQLRQAALAVAACLIDAGVQAQMPVAVSLPRGRLQVIAVLGVLAAGACYVPVGIKQPASRRAKIHRTAGIGHVLCSIEQRPELEAGDAVALIPVEQALTFTPLPGTVDVPHTAAAYVIFTSGSTGEPKGVQIAHHAAANTIDDLNSRYGIDRSSRGLAVSALDFDLSVYDLFGLLGAGGSLVLLNEQQHRDAASWLGLIQRYQVNLWNSVPVLLDMLLVVARHEQAVLPLRNVMLSGDWIGLDLPARLQLCTQGQARMIAMGGATEASIWSNVFDVPAQLPAHWTSIPYGKPLSNQHYRVVDELGRDCPDWVAGELWIGGVGVADGYRGAPELTAQRFVAHNGKRWYRTGDRGRYWPDGNLEFLGRLDHQVKVRGHRIELGEIETALSALPGVDHAIAVTTGSPASLAAALVVERRPLDERTYLRQLTQQLSAALPDYMVPSALVLLDELPLSANGKVDRKRVLASLAQLAQPASDAFEAPQDARERQVAAVWEEVLQQPRVGRRDSFFALGGDSLSGTQVIARLKQSGLGSEQGLRQLFANPQLADFAARLGAQTLSDTPRRLTANIEARHAPFPLTEVQRAYWMGQHGDLPLSCGSHYLLELDGEQVDLPRLEQAWNHLVQRHDMLRVVFDADRTQRVLAQVPPVRIDIDSHAATDLAQARARLHQAWHGQPVKLGHWPLFALRAVRYGQARWRLGIFLNYMALDGYSIKLLLNELATVFARPGQALPDIGIGFRDYVEQVRPDPVALRRAQAWWRAKLEHLPAAAALPLACDPQTLTDVQFTRRSGRLDQATWQQLRSLARQHAVTPSVLVLVAYAQVLSQWSGGTAHTLNMTLFDRQDVHPDIHRVLGDFTSLAPVAYDPQNGASLLQQAQAMQQEIADALDHREVSSIWVQRERARRLGSSGAALPVVFTSTLGISDSLFDQALPDGFPDLADGGLSQTPQVWLDHQMYEHHGELLFSWDVVEALFPEGLIDSMFAAFVARLEGLVEHDWSAPTSLALPPRDLEARLKANATERPRRLRGLHTDVFARALHAPERTALIDDAGALSFAELTQRALAVAACLIESGVQAQMPVAVSLPRGRQQIIAVLGVLAAGACYVPIGIKQPASRRAKIHRTAGIGHVLCSADHCPELLADDQVTLIAVEQAQEFTPLAPALDVDPAGPAYVIFTSGSTGEPKGVQIAHHAAANTLDDLNRRYGIDQSSRGLAVSALDFDLSVYDLFGLLGAGGSLVLISEEQQRDAASWLALIQAHQVNLWNSVPVLLDMLLVVARHEQAVLPLRNVMLSGDWIGLDLPARLQQCTNGQARMIAMGGATEASIWSNVFDVPAQLPAHWTSIPYGKPLGNQHYRVVDDQGRDCPDWVAGELWIGGVGVADGYRGAPELTAQRFVEHDGQRWYRTGDRGRYWPDGNLEFLGRLDHQVKVRGHRIELGEIETALAALPGVDHAIAVTTGSPATLAAALVMAVVPADPAPCIGAFKQRLGEVLPDYMVPAHLLLLAQLPLSANGKVDRATVLAQLADVHPQASAHQAPLAGLESEIAAVWRAVLQRPAVSRHDDFFAIGGDSLSATRIVTLLQERLGAQAVTLRTLYAQAPTVAALAAHIQACGRSHPLRPAPVEQALYEEGIL